MTTTSYPAGATIESRELEHSIKPRRTRQKSTQSSSNYGLLTPLSQSQMDEIFPRNASSSLTTEIGLPTESFDSSDKPTRPQARLGHDLRSLQKEAQRQRASKLQLRDQGIRGSLMDYHKTSQTTMNFHSAQPPEFSTVHSVRVHTDRIETPRRQSNPPSAPPSAAKDTFCRNVTIYGHCRYENTCPYIHDYAKLEQKHFHPFYPNIVWASDSSDNKLAYETPMEPELAFQLKYGSEARYKGHISSTQIPQQGQDHVTIRTRSSSRFSAAFSRPQVLATKSKHVNNETFDIPAHEIETHASRRDAAATALHNAAYVMETRQQQEKQASSSSRSRDRIEDFGAELLQPSLDSHMIDKDSEFSWFGKGKSSLAPPPVEFSERKPFISRSRSPLKTKQTSVHKTVHYTISADDTASLSEKNRLTCLLALGADRKPPSSNFPPNAAGRENVSYHETKTEYTDRATVVFDSDGYPHHPQNPIYTDRFRTYSSSLSSSPGSSLDNSRDDSRMKYFCPVEGCSRSREPKDGQQATGFRRRDNLARHFRRKHQRDDKSDVESRSRDYSPAAENRSIISMDDSELENELASLPASRETRWEQVYVDGDTRLVQRTVAGGNAGSLPVDSNSSYLSNNPGAQSTRPIVLHQLPTARGALGDTSSSGVFTPYRPSHARSSAQRLFMQPNPSSSILSGNRSIIERGVQLVRQNEWDNESGQDNKVDIGRSAGNFEKERFGRVSRAFLPRANGRFRQAPAIMNDFLNPSGAITTPPDSSDDED